VKGLQVTPGDGQCWCHARFGLRAEAASDGLCGRCAGRSPSACLKAHTAERLKAIDAAEADLVKELAWMLVRIENNWTRETSGPGSRFEGKMLETVQAEAVLRRLAEMAGAS